MGDVLAWWFWIEVLGLVALPPAFLLFRHLPDRGYFFAKPLGLLLLTYVLWLAGSLRLLPNGRGSALLIMLLLAAASLVMLRRCRSELVAHLSRNGPLIIFGEGLFLLLFLLWAVVRAHNPGIAHTEQPMDFAFFNASRRAEFFPPQDPWLAGHTVSYYYFGYVMMATISNLSGVVPAISYNLALALLFALTGLGAFSLVYNMVAADRASDGGNFGPSSRAVGFGLIGFLFVLGIGNLEGGLELLKAHGFGSSGFWQSVSIKDLANPYHSSHWYPTDNWWWWRATRVIDTIAGGKSLDYTITEFPFFSALLGDLHPHVMALPFGLLALALAFDAFRSSESLEGLVRRRTWRIVASALILGSLFFLNSWDFPTYAAIFLAATGLALLRGTGGSSGDIWKRLIAIGAPVLALAVVLFIPFYITFRSQASGLLPVSRVYSQPLHLFIFWGVFLLPLLGFLLATCRQGFRNSLSGRGRKLLVALLTLGPFILWALVALVLNARGSEQGTAPATVARKLIFLLPWLVLVPAALVALMRRLKETSAGFALMIVAAALLLTMAVELFFIRDTFGSRMNTVFKFYYQAWLLLGVSCAFGLAWLAGRWPNRGAARAGVGLWLLVSIGLIVVALVYPVASLITETRSFQGRGTLDGLSFVAVSSPHEYEAQRWLQMQVGTPVIVEAVGGQYSPYARVSARTGLPTVIGWPGHESQWRGSDRLFRGRPEDVDAVYKSEDLSLVRNILVKYDVSYVYVGDLERARYGAQVLDKFSLNFPVAFANQGVAIYAVKDRLAGAQKETGR